MKLVFALLIGLSTSIAFAKEVTVTVPDSGVQYDSMSVNFDGSTSIIAPKVFANGQFLPILDAPFGKMQAAQLACIAFGYTDNGTGTPREQGDAENYFALLGYSGSKVVLQAVYEKSHVQKSEVLEAINCK